MQIQQTTAVSANLPIASATGQGTERPISGMQSGHAVKPVESSTQQAVQATSSALRDEEVKEAVTKVNDMVSSMERGLEFSVDEDTNIKIVKVVDTQTNEVIRQIPSEEVVQISRWLDKLQGLLIKDKA